jgi:aminoglycoside phosphotransferase family enzyme
MINLIEQFEDGKFLDLGKPEQVVDTLISKLFFYKDFVYKVYKYQKNSFADLTKFEDRKNFFTDDFVWNNTMDPGTYIKLMCVKSDGISSQICSDDIAEDFCIVMKRIEGTNSIFSMIQNNTLTNGDVEKITKYMLSAVEKLTEIKKPDMEHLFSMSYLTLENQNLESNKLWMYEAQDFIPKERIDVIIKQLELFVNSHPYFKNFDTENYITSLDNHTNNIIIKDGEISIIDSMPPKEQWRVQSDAYVVSRFATDIEILLGSEYSDIAYRVLRDVRGVELDQKVKTYFQIIAACIRAPYFFLLNEKEIAERFLNFIYLKIRELE